MNEADEHLDELPEPTSPVGLGALLVATLAGVAVAVLVLPSWAPAIARSLEGAEPAAYWYLSRTSGLSAYALVWVSMMAGLSMTNRWARIWPGGPLVFDVHQHTALVGLAFALFHGLVLLGDRWLGASLWQLVVPFAVPNERAGWIGLGQIALWAMIPVALSFYVKKRIGQRTWRLLHFASFTVFALALVHGLLAGTDTEIAWVRAAYVASGGAVLLAAGRRLATGTRPTG